ncbi:stage III sporulation protein AG [Paenibacillus darwinianus]|uniref:Stage III sporulation protein AG n=1 Tax=Paenibacillus darwinianus TaxID=1380763 RepID=A0A9W5S0I8_9BACL|nr:stage III sporulation protein AG [Paenibacillus darwinianus]EXX86606.1 stage III sporulation protein AG [Paenibacillus darwinianus]EXX91496.1 stage III sporulation protein AG [Paenibacillus darwinianus]EXX91892.1 stage III sporulation protein AG [Paenibacillus darwinianus]
MAKWLEGLESAVGGGRGGPKRVKSLRWLLLIGCLGAGLLILNSFLSLREVPPSDNSGSPPPTAEEVFSGRQPDGQSPFETIEQPLELRLKEILEKIVGVGTVDVLVTIDSTEEIVYEKNGERSEQMTDENDGKGGRRRITSATEGGQVVLYELSGDQTPVITKKIKPRVRGILVVAKGAENATVRMLIADAVQKGVNVAPHRISVVPRKQG